MRRVAPRPLSLAVAVTTTLAPATTLARVQEIWEPHRGSGDRVGGAPHRRARRRPHGHLHSRRVGAGARPDGGRARESLNAALGADLVRELRCRTG